MNAPATIVQPDEAAPKDAASPTTQVAAEGKTSVDSLANEVRALRESLKKEPEPTSIKVLHVLEKLFIPVMLGVVAWVGNKAATEISKGQLALARTTAESQRAESRRTMQAKFIEIFYRDLNSGDQKSQLNAVRLVRLVDADLAQSLLDMVAVTPGLPTAVVAQATETRNAIDAIAPLQGFRIGIYFHRSDPLSKPTAIKLQGRLQEAGVAGAVELYPSDDAFFARPLNRLSTLEVRYEEGIENEPADALLRVVKRDDDRTRWQKKSIPTQKAQTSCRSSYRKAANPSLEPTRYGRRRLAGLRHSVHHRSAAKRRLPAAGGSARTLIWLLSVKRPPD